MTSKEPANNSCALNVKKIAVYLLILYIILTIGFYFLAGEQLRIRDSYGNVAMSQMERGTGELTPGGLVEQYFSAKIQRLTSVSVQFGSYYRENHGTITMELRRQDDDEILLTRDFNATDVAEGTILTIEAEQPLESVYDTPLVIRLYSDSTPGEGTTPMMDSTVSRDGYRLVVNGETQEGMLCFSAMGEDYIWFGMHYWAVCTAVGILLGMGCLVIWYRYKNGRRSYIINALYAMKKYRFLIRQLVARDFKTKYKRSVLGVLWSFLNPLLMMMVQYFVFSRLFKNDIQNFAVYLLVGVVMYNFFSETCSLCLQSILGNASLITKVYMPKYIYPFTRAMSSVINLAISMVPLVIVCLITSIHFGPSMVLMLYFMACLIVFALGMGMMLSTCMVFFRDTQFLWNVVSMMWMYATPIFYPEKILPPEVLALERFNPLYILLKSVRICVLEGISPDPIAYGQSLVVAVGMLVLGSLVFIRQQDKFVLYL